MTIKVIMEKMKGMREDARKIKDSNSGAVGGSEDLQNCDTSQQVPNDPGERRPTEGGLGSIQDEDLTTECQKVCVCCEK